MTNAFSGSFVVASGLAFHILIVVIIHAQSIATMELIPQFPSLASRLAYWQDAATKSGDYFPAKPTEVGVGRSFRFAYN